MDFEIKIMTPAERSYCYTGSQQLDKQTGCIGHLRGDMDRSGNGFFTSWEDHCGELKTQAFKDEFDDFINALRFDERYDGIFKNRSSLSRYILSTGHIIITCPYFRTYQPIRIPGGYAGVCLSAAAESHAGRL